MDYQNISVNPVGYCDKDGNVYKTLGWIKIGSVIYKKIEGKLVECEVVSTNPLTVRSKKA